jgi:hypothetical protein
LRPFALALIAVLLVPAIASAREVRLRPATSLKAASA